ncbi:hypothetical protein HK104_002573, partial [Borealophlyctis nickersoniae]
MRERPVSLTYTIELPSFPADHQQPPSAPRQDHNPYFPPITPTTATNDPITPSVTATPSTATTLAAPAPAQAQSGPGPLSPGGIYEHLVCPLCFNLPTTKAKKFPCCSRSVVCQECAKDWIRSGGGSCPFCRTELSLVSAGREEERERDGSGDAPSSDRKKPNLRIWMDLPDHLEAQKELDELEVLCPFAAGAAPVRVGQCDEGKLEKERMSMGFVEKRDSESTLVGLAPPPPPAKKEKCTWVGKRKDLDWHLENECVGSL